ncbi:MAG: hypothetical protein U1F76_19775 [Candidatus Competibacteraceae bacterium]
MDRDPEMNWPGGFPYDVLAPAGIDSESSMKAVRECRGYFIKQRQMDKVRSAYDALGGIQNRLFIDFFLYRTAFSVGTKEDNHDR